MRVHTTGALALIAVLTLAGAATAQDHVNVTIVAPSLGSFPRLVAGSFDIVNSDQLVSNPSTGPSGATGAVKMIGTTAPPKVQMTLAWGGEAAQLIEAATSSAVPSVIDHITCDFVHAGSNQPYYTVVVDHPIISHLALVYDSTSATATEEIEMQAPQVEYVDGSASTPPASGSAVVAPRAPVRGAAPRLRLVATPVMIRQLTPASTTFTAGPPVIGFVSFAAGTGNTVSHFAPEGTFPAWASGAMAGVDSIAITFDRPILVHTQQLANGMSQSTPLPGSMKPATASFVKPVGSASNDLQAALAATKPVTMTFELADAPGRLAYSIQFTNGLIASDHTSLTNGHASERVTVKNGLSVTFKNLRNNTTAIAN